MQPLSSSTGTTSPATLIQAIFQEKSIVRNLILALAGSLLLYASAKMKVPFYPVPMTMQTFVVLVIGMLFGWRLAMFTVGLYLLGGAMGLPVFSGTPERGIGLAYMAGPTGGYLIGFLVAAGVCGWLAERGWDRNMPAAFFAMVIGTAIIYACGISWLSNLIGWEKAIAAGMMPFLYGDLLKVVLAALLLPRLWKIFGK